MKEKNYGFILLVIFFIFMGSLSLNILFAIYYFIPTEAIAKIHASNMYNKDKLNCKERIDKILLKM